VVEGVNAGTQRVGICQACHAATSDALRAPTAWTKYWNRLGYDDPDGVGGTAPTGSTHNATSTTTPYCVSCHTHGTGFGGECVGCHATTQPITQGPLAGTRNRREVVSEFQNAWSHKASTSTVPANRTVSNYDCAVCHMEGDPATGNPTSSHGDGYLNLRDPDTGANIKGVTFSQTIYTDSTNGGSYSSTTAEAAPAEFNRNVSAAFAPTPGTNDADVAAIMINQCLKCHDSDGAMSTLARVPTSVMPNASAGKPFGTTILGTGYAGGTGLTACASGTDGCVTDVDSSFATSNASYHPIRGKQNNSYVNNVQMVAPWNALTTDKTKGTINTANSWGYLITCWDCHAASGASGPQTSTVTAHGGSVTIRAGIWVSSILTVPTTTNAGNLCRVCHFPSSVTRGHGPGSAAASIDSNPTSRMAGGCYLCHLSAQTKPSRPIPAQDAHGFDSFATNMGTDKMWPVGATESYKPYGFMRNVGPTGQWLTQNWRPRTAPGLTAGSGTCGGTACRSSHGTYNPGGVY
jgi:hypothetical protein